MGFLSEYEDFGLDSDDLRFVWTFDPVTIGSPPYIPDDIVGGNGSGVFESGPNANFDSVLGQSFWSGDRVKVENSNGLSTWELFMVFERDGFGSADILASTRTTLEGAGFSFGVNEANIPFIYTNLAGDSEMTMFNSLSMSQNNTICLSKGRDSVTLSLYRPSGGYIDSETVSIQGGSLGNGEVFLGADIFLSGDNSPLPNSSFVGTIQECALSELGIANGPRRHLLHNSYSGYEDSSKMDGLVASESVGCSFINMLSLEKANGTCGFNSASSSFYVPERENLTFARVFADGIEDSAATIASNGDVSFSVQIPTGAIYDIYIVGVYQRSAYTPSADFVNFTPPAPTNSFYGVSSGRRLEKSAGYFEASVLNLFYGKPLGGTSPKSNNILCQK